MLLLLMQQPSMFDPQSLSGWDRLGIVAIIIGGVGAFLFALFTRKIILGSTHALLMKAEQEKTEFATAEAVQARKDLSRVSDDFNANLERVLAALVPSSARATDAFPGRVSKRPLNDPRIDLPPEGELQDE